MHLAQAHEQRLRCQVRFQDELSTTIEKWEQSLQVKTWLPYHTRLWRAGRAIFRTTYPHVELIVAGYTEDTEVLLSTAYKNPPEIASSYVTIGSGGLDAEQHLNFRKQNPHYSFVRTVLHVAEALQAAKFDPFVGPPADYIVMQGNQQVPMKLGESPSFIYLRFLHIS